MANDKEIKIGVKFVGDDLVDLKKSVSDIKKEIKNVNREIDSTNRKMVFRDPSTGRMRSTSVSTPISSASKPLTAEEISYRKKMEQGSTSWASESGRISKEYDQRVEQKERQSKQQRANQAYAESMRRLKEKDGIGKQVSDRFSEEKTAGRGGIGSLLKSVGGVIGGTTGRLLSMIGGASGPLAAAGIGVWAAKKYWDTAMQFTPGQLALHGLGANRTTISSSIVAPALRYGFGPNQAYGMAQQFLQAGGGLEGFDTALKATRGMGIDFGTLASTTEAARKGGIEGKRDTFEKILANAVASGVEQAKLTDYLQQSVRLLNSISAEGPSNLVGAAAIMSNLTKNVPYFGANIGAAGNAIGTLNSAIQGQAFGGSLFGILGPSMAKRFNISGALDLSALLKLGMFGGGEQLDQLNLTSGTNKWLSGMGVNKSGFTKKFTEALVEPFLNMAPTQRYFALNQLAPNANPLQMESLMKSLDEYNKGKGSLQGEKALEDFRNKLEEANKNVMDTLAGKMQNVAANTEAIKESLSTSGLLPNLMADLVKFFTNGAAPSLMRLGMSDASLQATSVAKRISEETGLFDRLIAPTGVHGDFFSPPGTYSSFSNIARDLAERRTTREYGIYDDLGMHSGIDKAASLGEIIKSPVFGTIERIGKTPKGGIEAYVRSKETGGLLMFAHLAENYKQYIKEGMNVFPGDPLGEVGLTGRTTKPHIHAQYWDAAGNLQNPQGLFQALASPLSPKGQQFFEGEVINKEDPQMTEQNRLLRQLVTNTSRYMDGQSTFTPNSIPVEANMSYEIKR